MKCFKYLGGTVTATRDANTNMCNQVTERGELLNIMAEIIKNRGIGI